MSVSVKPGDVIDGTYTIERLLGQGGMGAVFVAHEERLGRKVAIKVLLDTVATNPEAVIRFEREARAAAVLQSDNVTRVLSVGKLATGAPYIVMELLEGEDLSNVLLRRGSLSAQEVVTYMIQACEALAEAHALGIVHRDLKPANLFLAKRPTGTARIKVLDFGISKGATAAASQQALTKTTALMGTPIYMSPEQLREARNVDGRADVWALGIMMYELLTGAPPFQSEALAELCVLIMTTKHPPLSSRRPDVPPALEAIVNRCLEKEPGDRFATAQDLMTALASASLTPSQPTQAAAHPAPLPPRQATPRMSPRLETAAVAERMRMQAPTEAQAAAGYRPNLPNLPTPAGAAPPHMPQTGPTNFDPRLMPGTAGDATRAVHAGTVDPVSNTQPWLPPKRPSLLGLGLVFAGALSIGAVTLYLLLLRPPSSDGGGTAAANGSSSGLVSSAPSAASSSGTSAVSTSASTASAASAPSASTAAASASALRLAPLVTASPPPPPQVPVGVTSKPPPGPAGLPPPPGLALPPPNGASPPPPPVHVTTPSAKPPPVPNPGSLMPGARN